MTVDGVTNLDTGSNTTVHSMPSMDSVAEVKVLMSAYSAGERRNPGLDQCHHQGRRDAVSRTGGSYFRNEDLNANNYFSNQAERPSRVPL